MTRTRTLGGIPITLLSLALGTAAWAQGDCLNEDLYPALAVTPASDGTVTEISTCSFETEHSQITGINAGATYEFTLESGGYITVRQDTYDGPVIAQGSASVVATAATNGDLFAHWNTDADCGTNSECFITTVQLFLNCTPPAASYTLVEDCDAQNYTVLLNITSLGDAGSLNVEVELDGNVDEITGVGVGELPLGPFAFDEIPVVRVLHDTDPACNRTFNNIDFQTNCPILVDCGVPGLDLTYCYTANDDQTWHFGSTGTGTLRLRFIRGTIESNTFDDLRIYDGSDNTAPLLFEHTEAARRHLGPVGSALTDPNPTYYGVDVFATGPSIYMEMTSDGSVQCGSAEYDPWEWEVVCLDCELPAVSYAVVDDCPNDQFTIQLDVTSLGDASALDFVYTINGTDPQTATNIGLGMVDLGPFAIDDTVNMTVVHPGSELCNVSLGNITTTGTCPLLIDCGTEVMDSTCYANWADERFYYQGTGTYPLAVFFDGGQLFFGDSVMIYDGGSIDSPILFQGTNQQLAGTFFYTTNPEHRLTIRVRANGFTSCGDGGTTEPVAWRISCLDCVPPTATFSIVQDCENFQYFIDVDVTDLGTDPMPQITTTVAQDTLEIDATGTYQLGPFVSGTELEVTIVNDANSLCNIYSGMMVNPLCPTLIECPGPTLVETYCYVANDAQAWAYELNSAGGNATLRLSFVRGTIESSTFDHLRIYDGVDNTAPLLFDHTAAARRHLGPEGSAILDPAPVYSTVDVAATGNNLYMEMTSDGSVQCEGSTEYDEWEWEVYCLDCASPEVSFNVVPVCTSRGYSVEVEVTAVGGDATLTATNLGSGEEQTGLGTGTYTFGPYPVGEENVFRVFNETYPQCRATSDSLTYTAEECISVTCGFDNYTHCYGNDEDRWYTYQSAQNVPITLAFLGGQMLAGDRIVLYNGRDENAAVLYQGNNGGNFNGFAIPSANIENILTLRIESDGTGSCDDGGVSNPLSWTVACGGVGIEELGTSSIALYPNPTNGLLTIAFGEAITGKVSIRVLDMSGRTVIETPVNMAGADRSIIDLSNLQQGNYMVQVRTADHVTNQRVQVTR
ncbi:MAG: T9SS type A sorting domain-containing protein [Flavobacteriales bacterium]|nr:T9SS type A sorting domain-containing protein [Flavobacteriales bacterium]